MNGQLSTLLVDSAFGDHQAVEQQIRDSGVYNTFEREFVRKFSDATSAYVRVLNPSKYVYVSGCEKNGIDALASAKAEGDGAVLSVTVWPSLWSKILAVGQRR